MVIGGTMEHHGTKNLKPIKDSERARELQAKSAEARREKKRLEEEQAERIQACLLYTSPSPRDS